MVSSVKLSSISSSEELDELLDEVLDNEEVDDDVDEPEDEDPSFTSKDIFFSQKFQIQKKWPKWPFSFVIVFTLFFPFDTQQLDSLLSSHQRLEKQEQNF